MARSPEQWAHLGRAADELRRDVVEMVSRAGSGHPGGSLSAAEIVAVLYGSILRVDPTSPRWIGRDRFVLSKGHAAPIVYAALAARGFFPSELLATLRKIGSSLQGHPDMTKTPGIDMTTGSLGQGLSVGLGMALAGRHLGHDYHVFVLLSDGELQEGMVWEAAMVAAHYRVGNLTAIIDRNMIQQSAPTEEVVSLEPMVSRWTAFGWDAVECDGHDVNALEPILRQRRGAPMHGMPGVVIAKTIKGKGVSFMENVVDWHHGAITPDHRARALAEIEARLRVGGVAAGPERPGS
jgi:transketolase